MVSQLVRISLSWTIKLHCENGGEKYAGSDTDEKAYLWCKIYIKKMSTIYFTAATLTRLGAITPRLGLARPFQARQEPSKTSVLMKDLQLIVTRQNLSDFMKYLVLTTTFSHISSFPLHFAAIRKKMQEIEWNLLATTYTLQSKLKANITVSQI